MDYNAVTISGRLASDASIKYLNAGTAVTSFSIATNKKYKKLDEWLETVSFYDIECFGKLAEWKKDLKKGDRVVVCGELKQDRWQTSEGQTRSKIVVTAIFIEESAKITKRQEEIPPKRAAQAQFEDDVPF